MAIVLIGIDDTDNDTSPGTGQLSRWLAREIELRGGSVPGITRHQFLLDDRIRYTSHNSGACLAVDWTHELNDLYFCAELISTWSAEGSDPGICIVPIQAVPSQVMDWGNLATQTVLLKSGAIQLADTHGLYLKALGGTGDGVIGALASVGLRAKGENGRFLDLPGLRSLAEQATLAELNALGIQVQHHSVEGGSSLEEQPLGGDRLVYKTMNWVRPRLSGGRPVWDVEWSKHEHAWIPVDRKKSRPLE
jgi:hypothetical protein